MSAKCKYCKENIFDSGGQAYGTDLIDGTWVCFDDGCMADCIEELDKKLNTKMPCGHTARYAALDAIERQYCVRCKAENLQHENDFLNGVIAGQEAQS